MVFEKLCSVIELFVSVYNFKIMTSVLS